MDADICKVNSFSISTGPNSGKPSRPSMIVPPSGSPIQIGPAAPESIQKITVSGKNFKSLSPAVFVAVAGL